MDRENWTDEEKHICDSRTSCLGCPYVDDDGFFVECKLQNGKEGAL